MLNLCHQNVYFDDFAMLGSSFPLFYLLLVGSLDVYRSEMNYLTCKKKESSVIPGILSVSNEILNSLIIYQTKKYDCVLDSYWV